MYMGRILVLDGAVQISSKRFDNDNYTKEMTDNVVSKSKQYEHVMIIGGGDLVIAAYLLKNFPNVKKVTVCDIDERVIEVTKHFFSIGKTIIEE